MRFDGSPPPRPIGTNNLLEIHTWVPLFVVLDCVRPLLRSHAIYVVLELPLGLLHDEPMYVGLEAGELRIELPRELQIAHDRRVEAFSRDQQRNAGRIGRQQDARDAALELI